MAYACTNSRDFVSSCSPICGERRFLGKACGQKLPFEKASTDIFSSLEQRDFGWPLRIPCCALRIPAVRFEQAEWHRFRQFSPLCQSTDSMKFKFWSSCLHRIKKASTARGIETDDNETPEGGLIKLKRALQYRVKNIEGQA